MTVLLLLMLAYFLIRAYFLWHSTEKTKQSEGAKGFYVILFVILAIGVGVWIKNSMSSFPFVFFTEIMLFLAFGISWLVKSDAFALLRDKNNNNGAETEAL